MSAEKSYFVDAEYPEQPTYILFSILDYEVLNVPIALKIGENYIQSYRNLIVWRWTGKTQDVEVHDPPFLPHCDPSSQLVPSNVGEVKLLHDEATLTGAFEVIEPNLIHITLFEYFKGWNISLQDGESNKWVVYREATYPNFEDTAIRRFEKEVLRD